MNSIYFTNFVSPIHPSKLMEDPNFKAFPTYPLIMGFKGTEFEVVNFYEKAAAKIPPCLPKIGTSNQKTVGG